MLHGHVSHRESIWSASKRVILCLAWIGCFAAVESCAWEPPRHTGLDFLTHFADLPYFYSGTLTRQNASFDPTGANDDGFACNHWAYSDNGYVLLDEVGPGCIENIWCTSPPDAGRIRIYFDGEVSPRVDLGILAFFSGNVTPFLSPLVGDDYASSSGFYCKVPLVFASRVRIVFSGTPCFWSVLWHRYPPGTPATSFSMGLDVSQAVALYSAAGNDPKSTAGNETLTGVVTPGAGQSVVLLDRRQSGALASLKIDPSPANESSLAGVWLRITFDDAPQPQVEAPLGLFFGCGAGETNVRGLPIGMSTGGWYYCYFPMPFWRAVRVELQNRSATSITAPYEIQLNGTPYDHDAGFFCATYRRENPTGSGDYLFLDVAGTGHYLGVSMRITGPADYAYLEGDERFYVDGSLTPQVHGTGTEDYLLAGWYFGKGPFTLPTHGMTWQDNVGDQKRLCMYRFHLNDRVPFTSRLVAGIEHGPTNNVSADYASVAYYYWKPSISSFVCDVLDVGDTASENAHSYNVTGQNWSGSVTSAYDGDGGTLADHGRRFSGASQFRLSVPSPGTGLFLRRRLDHAAGRQQGSVSVNGAFLVRWETNDQNASRRWYDTELFVPPASIAGQANPTVRVDSSNWSEFHYWASILAQPGAPWQQEAEGLIPSGSSGRDLLHLQGATPYWTWGGSILAEYQAIGAGDWIAFDIPVPGPGWYGVWPVLSRRDGSGVVQVLIDGVAVGDPINLQAVDYRQGPVPGPGRLIQSNGSRYSIRLNVVGKDTTSSGYLVGIDAFCFAPVAAGGSPTATPPLPTPSDTATPSGTPLATQLPVDNGGFEGVVYMDPDGEHQRPEHWGCGNAPTGSWQAVPQPPRAPKHKVEVNWNQRSGQKCLNLRDLAGPGQAYIVYSSQIPVAPGSWVTASAWYRNYKDTGNPANCACSIGLHPAGGIDPAGVVWGLANTAENSYTEVRASAPATGNGVRVFLRVSTQAAFVDAVLWDDVTVYTQPYTAPTPTPTSIPARRPSVEFR